ncbi:hypothetical protein PTKIN_Ptkin17bG0036500 [Pterospermum kingtungense]
MIFLISQSTREELIDIMNATRNGVLSTGAVLTGTMGPRTGTVDIGEYADSYYFRVILAGVSSDERDFSCDIEPNGTVLIKGILKTGEKIVCRNYEMFHMLTQNVGHPGPFTISFQLPGLVYPQQVISNLADGILEVSVKKRKVKTRIMHLLSCQHFPKIRSVIYQKLFLQTVTLSLEAIVRFPLLFVCLI